VFLPLRVEVIFRIVSLVQDAELVPCASQVIAERECAALSIPTSKNSVMQRAPIAVALFKRAPVQMLFQLFKGLLHSFLLFWFDVCPYRFSLAAPGCSSNRICSPNRGLSHSARVLSGGNLSVLLPPMFIFIRVIGSISCAIFSDDIVHE